MEPAYRMWRSSNQQIGGTHGSLSVPRLELWTNKAKRGWWNPSRSSGTSPPMGREGLMTLKVIDAVKRAATTGELVKIEQQDLRS
jgi:hypothetical protein